MMVFALTAALGLNINVVARVNSRAVRSFSRVVNPRMVELVEAGEFGTTDYSMTFKEGGDVVSPWHDMPLELDGGLYNMLTEIPKVRGARRNCRPTRARNALFATEPTRTRARRVLIDDAEEDGG